MGQLWWSALINRVSQDLNQTETMEANCKYYGMEKEQM